MPKTPKPGFYAVRIGRCPGIYLTWDECKLQITGHPGATYKKFYTKTEAEEFALQLPPRRKPQTTARYATQTRSHQAVPSTFPLSSTFSSSFHLLPSSLSPPSPSYRRPLPLFPPLHQRLLAFTQRVGSTAPPSALPLQQGNVIVVYTDGASSKNGTKSARAGFGAFFGPNDP
ncbi:Caulimovirus viroplasmin-domain-containing protein, partial [Endogone sp. FLAS-F59071]